MFLRNTKHPESLALPPVNSGGAHTEAFSHLRAREALEVEQLQHRAVALGESVERLTKTLRVKSRRSVRGPQLVWDLDAPAPLGRHLLVLLEGEELEA
jgi:hypothetical protein